MNNSQPPVKFLNESQDSAIDCKKQIRFEEPEPIILKIVKDLKAIISIDTVVRLVMDSDKVNDNAGMLTLPFQIDSNIVYHNIAKLLHDSFIAYYLSSDPKTSHFGLAISTLGGEASSLLCREAERLIQLAENRNDIAGQFIHGVEFSVESTETPPLSPVFNETLVKGLDIHLGLDICIYGASLNYNRIFIPIQTGGKIIEKIYSNLEQLIQHNLVTYDEVNDNHLKISETLIFKELEKIVNRLPYKINTRRKLLANLKANTVYLGRTADDYQFNLIYEQQPTSEKDDTEKQSPLPGSKIDEMNLVGNEISVSPDIKKKQVANRSMKSYGAFLENLKEISQSSGMSGDTNQKKVMDYGKGPSVSSIPISSSEPDSVSEKKPIRFKRSPEKADISTPPTALSESAKNVSETRSFTIKSSSQTVRPNQDSSLRIPTTSTINANDPEAGFNRKRDYAHPSSIKFSERDKAPTNQNILDHSGHKDRSDYTSSLGPLDDRTNQSEEQKSQLPSKLTEREHSEHPLPSIRKITADTPKKPIKTAPATLESNTTIIEDRPIKEQPRFDKAEIKITTSKTDISYKNRSQAQTKSNSVESETIKSDTDIKNDARLTKPPGPFKTDSNTITSKTKVIKEKPTPGGVVSREVQANIAKQNPVIIKEREHLLRTKQNKPESKTTVDSGKTIEKANQIPEQPRPESPTTKSNIDNQPRILSHKKTPGSTQNNLASKSDRQNSDRSTGSGFLNAHSQEPTEDYSETNIDGSSKGNLLPNHSVNLKQNKPLSKQNGVKGNQQKNPAELPKNPSNNISKLLEAKYSQHPTAEQKVSREFQYYLGMENFILPDIIPNEPSGVRNRPSKLIIVGENNHCGGDEYCAGKRILDNDCNALKSITGCRGMDLTCVITMIKIQLDALNNFLGTEKRPPNKLSMRVEDAEEIIETIRREVVRSTENNEEEYSRKEIYRFITDLLLEKLYANKQISKYFYGLTVDVAETKSFQDLDPAIIKKFKKVLVGSYKILKRAEQK